MREKLVCLLMQKTFQSSQDDKIIAKILLMKKTFYSVRFEKENRKVLLMKKSFIFGGNYVRKIEQWR